MAQLSKIVSEINSSIALALNKKKLGKSQCLGISELVTDKKNKTIPVLIDLSGDGKYAGYDDINSIRLYHRLLDSSYKGGQLGYGNGKDITQIANLSCVVAFKVNTIRFMPDDVEALIVSAFPASVSSQIKNDLGLKSCGVFVTGSYHDTQAIFAREYKGQQYSPDTNIRMFDIRYSIECTWGQSCINSICCI